MRTQPVALADTNPLGEAVTAQPGVMALPPRADHAHPRLTSTTSQSTVANGEATIAFTRTFAAEPGLALMPRENADNGALSWKVRSWVQDGSSNYTGVVIKFYRIQPLPSVLTLLTQLLSFRVDAGTVGVIPFTCIAVASSAP